MPDDKWIHVPGILSEEFCIDLYDKLFMVNVQ